MNLKPTRQAKKANRLARLQAELQSSKKLETANAPKIGLKPCDSRLKWHVPETVTHQYGNDKSGTVEYRFNLRGYRSEDYRRDARFRICIIGESHAIGTGIHFADTFGFKLKTMMAGVLKLKLEEVNLINLSIGGSSADYCARTIYRQLPILPTDFVVCIVPLPDRIEYRNEEGYNTLVVGSVDVNHLDKMPPSLVGYCEYYDDAVGRLNRVKNMLLIQSYLRLHDIEYVMAVEKLPQPGDGFDALDPFLEQLDGDRTLRHEFFMQKADRAADGSHAGPRSHAAFAIKVFHQFGRLLKSRDMADLADLVETEANRLMVEDDDYQFCTAGS